MNKNKHLTTKATHYTSKLGIAHKCERILFVLLHLKEGAIRKPLWVVQIYRYQEDYERLTYKRENDTLCCTLIKIYMLQG